MRFQPVAVLLSALAVAALALAACGGGDDADEIDPSILGTEVPGPTPPKAGNQEIAMTATDFAFDPATPGITAGAAVTVKFTNAGQSRHTLNFFSDSELRNRIGETGQIEPGGTAQFSFIAPRSGEKVYFRCQLHPSQMKGEVTTK